MIDKTMEVPGKYSDQVINWALSHGLRLIVIIIIFVALMSILRFALKKFIAFSLRKEEEGSEKEKRVQTMTRVLYTAGGIILIVTGLMTMISELGIPAWPVGLLIALRYLLSPLSLWAGHRSDTKPLFGSYRTSYIWFARGLMVISFPLLGVSLGRLSLDQGDPFGWGAALASFLLYGLGTLISGSPFLALVRDSAPPRKQGLAISIVETVAYQLYGEPIRINAICPGLIQTGMTRPVFDMAQERGTLDRIGQINPTRRAGQPEEIGQMACFLLSDRASYVNGQAIAVDGGLSASHPWAFPRQQG